MASAQKTPLFTMYPNPLKSGSSLHLTLTSACSEHVHITLNDVLGKECYAESPEKIDAGSYPIETSKLQLAPGSYFLRVQSGSMIETRKFEIVQ